MFVTIGGTYIWTGKTWNDYPTDTWSDIAEHTWYDACDPDTHIRLGTASIEHTIDGRSTATFEYIDFNATNHFDKGQEVLIRDVESNILFGGLIEEVTEELIGSASDPLVHMIQAADYTSIADRRLFVGAYESTTAGDIVRDIMSVLSEDGITEGLIQEGEVLERQLFPYSKCSEALDKLAELCGFIWFIDYDKKLYFVDRSAYAAEWSLTSYDDVLQGSLRVSRGNPEYRNIQYVSGGSALTNTMTEYFKGDSVQRSFTVGYPIADEPQVYVNDVPKVVGLKGADKDCDWYYAKGDATITQDPSGDVLTADDTLKVVYVGQYTLIAKVSQYAEITNRRLIEGFGSGKYERLDNDPTLVDHDAAIEAARSKLLNYAVVGAKIEYSTLRHGLAAGVLQHIHLPVHGIDDDCLITRITVQFREGGKSEATAPYVQAVYSVEAVTGPADRSWEEIFCRLAEAARRKNDETVSDTGTVQGLEEFSKTWLSSHHPNPFISICPGDGSTPASVDFPCLADEDRLKYIVLYSNGVEFFRKPITSQTQSATEIDSICIIQANEANGVPISHVGLWGGNSCSQTTGSGIEMEKFSFQMTKNALQSLQINFYDVKGW
jgi:hypothetical protein